MFDFSIDKNTIVIGAGPAGLAVGACLQRAGIQSIILEQSSKVASAWHRHYDRLHLHTDKKNSELPYVPFPREYPRYISRTQLIEYLETYARKLQLDIRFYQQVLSACYENEQWKIQTQDKLYRSPILVIAAGYTREPNIPNWPGQNSFTGRVIHSSQYKNGEPFKGERILVVGFGNSGGEIAIDLWEHGAHPSLAVRNAVNVIPRELFGIPILSIGIVQGRMPPKLADAINAPILRAVIGDLTKYGFRKLPYGPATQIRQDKHIPLIDIGTMKLIQESYVTIHPGVKEFTADGVIFMDGKQAQFDAVILATGYRPQVNAFLHGASNTHDEAGTPSSSGRETSMPGLYFCGYYVSPTGMLREIGIEARQISAAIAKNKT